MRKIEERKTYLCASFFLIFTLCIFAPFELYIGNLDSRTEMWFDFKDFWFIPILIGIFCFSVLAFIGYWLRGKWLSFGGALIAGVGIALYLQGNFLGIKSGEMLGESFESSRYAGRICLNSVLLICINMAVLYSVWKWRRKAERCLRGLAVFLTMMQLMTLIVLIPRPLEKQLHEKKTVYTTDKDIMNFSKDRNIVVLLLDMYDARFFNQALEEEPELSKILDGFTYYENMAGGYMTTTFSIPFLMTGIYCQTPLPVENYINQVSNSNRLYWDELLDSGWEIGVYTDEYIVPERLKRKAINCIEDTAYISNKIGFSLDLYRFVMCKYFPDFFKSLIWMNGEEFLKWKGSALGTNQFWNYDNAVFQKYLEKSMNVTNEFPQYKFIHIQGVHPPHHLDEDGLLVEEETGNITCAKGSLRIVGEYLQKMKDVGIYDSSAIIIMADHGEIIETQPTVPLFLVKNPGMSGPMKTNAAPVSQLEYGSTLLELAGIADKDTWGPSVFDFNEKEKRERIYYNTRIVEIKADGEEINNLVEYIIDDVVKGETVFHKTGVEYDIDGKQLYIEPE